MPSSSDNPIPTPRQSWLNERRTEAVAAFAARTPAIYEEQITIHPQAAAWADQQGPAPRSLFLTGPIGVGKTHTAWQAARRWVGAYFGTEYRGTPTVEAWRSTSLFDALRPDAHETSGRALVRTLQKAGLLFMDDLAAARPSSWTQERLYEIFDERYVNRRPVIITCDVLPNQLAEVVGDRVSSRLAEMCRDGVLMLKGADRRMGGAA